MTVREVVLHRDIRSPLDLSPRSLVNRYVFRRTVSVLTLMAIDSFSIVAAALVATAAVHHYVVSSPMVLTATGLLTAAAITIVVFLFSGLYGLRLLRHSVRRIVQASVVAVVAIVLVAIASDQAVARGSLIVIWVIALIFTIVARSFYDWCLAQVYEGSDLRPIIILGNPDDCEQASALISASRQAKQSRIVGVVSDEPVSDEWQQRTGLPALGTIDRLERIVRHEGPMELVVSDPALARTHIVSLVDICRRHRITLKLVALELDLGSARLSYLPGFDVPLFVVKPTALAGAAFFVKRVLDIMASVVALVVLSPVFLIVTVAIRLTSAGPAFFVDDRIGLGQQPFRCYKFRTMCRNALNQQESLEPLNEATGAIFKIRDDPRITPVGRALRRLSLDELPQLLNVVKGEMSLVGPRPLPLRDFRLLDDVHKQRHVVLPGITGLWQVSGRSRLSFDDMIDLDLRYIEHWSIGADMAILLRTAGAVLGLDGAY